MKLILKRCSALLLVVLMLMSGTDISAYAASDIEMTYVASDGDIKSFELYFTSNNIQSFTATWVEYFKSPKNIGAVTLAEGADGADGSAYVVFKAKDGYKFSGFSADGIFASSAEDAKLTTVAYESYTSDNNASEAHTLTHAKKFLAYSNSWSNCYNYRYDLFPEKAKYLKVVLPYGSSSMVFANNFKFTMIPDSQALYSTAITDEFDNESIDDDCNISSQEYAGFYVSSSPQLGDGHYLAIKTSFNVESSNYTIVTFRAPPGFKYKTFTMTAYAQGANAKLKTLSFEAGTSEKGRFLKIPADISYSTSSWIKCVYDFDALPANTKYIRMTFPKNMLNCIRVDALSYTVADDEEQIREMPYERYEGMNLTEPERPASDADSATFENVLGEYGEEKTFTMDITESSLEKRRVLEHSGLNTFHIMTAWQLSATAPDIKVICSSAYTSNGVELGSPYWLKTGGIPADHALTGFDIWLRTPESFKIYTSDTLDGEYTELTAVSSVKDTDTYKEDYYWSADENKLKEYYRPHWKVHYDIPVSDGYRYIKIQCMPSETTNDFENHFIGIWNYSYKKVKAYNDSAFIYRDYEDKSVIMAPQGKKISSLEYTVKDGDEGTAYFSGNYTDGFSQSRSYKTAVTFKADDTQGNDKAWNIIASSTDKTHNFSAWMNGTGYGGDGAKCLAAGKVAGVDTPDYWVVTGGIDDGLEMKKFEIRSAKKSNVKILGSASLDGEYTEVPLDSEKPDTGNKSSSGYAPKIILSYNMTGRGYKYIKIQSLATDWGDAIFGKYSYTYDVAETGEEAGTKICKVAAPPNTHYAYIGGTVPANVKVYFASEDDDYDASAVINRKRLSEYSADPYIVDYSGITTSATVHNLYGGKVSGEYTGDVSFDDDTSFITLSAPDNSVISYAEFVVSSDTKLEFAEAESRTGRYDTVTAIRDESVLGSKYVRYTISDIYSPYLRISANTGGMLVGYYFNWQGAPKKGDQGDAQYIINVDYNDIRQEIKAWGLFPGFSTELADEYKLALFDELNPGIVRLELYGDVDSNGNLDVESSTLKNIISFINMAKSYDLEYMITIWSPPASMKTNGKKWGVNSDGSPAYLLESREDDFVKFISDCLIYIKEKTGTLPVGFSFANEPPNSTTYQSCAYTKEQLRRVLVKLDKKLDTDGLGDVMMLSPETNTLKGAGQFIEYDWSWLNTNEGQAVDAVIYHVYRDTTNNHPNDKLEEALANLSKTKKRETWQTEYCPAGLKISEHRFANEILRKINHDTQHMGVSRWLYWTGVINSKDDETLINVVDGTAHVKKEYYLLRTLYNSVPSGSSVVNLSIDDPHAADELEACYTQSDVGAFDTNSGTVVTLANTSDFSKSYSLTGLRGSRALVYIFRGNSEVIDHVFLDVTDGTVDGLTLDAYDCAIISTSDSFIADSYADVVSKNVRLITDSQALKDYSNPVLLRAVYDGDKMESIERIALDKGDEYTISVNEYSEGKTVKLFLWNMENLQPIYTKSINP